MQININIIIRCLVILILSAGQLPVSAQDDGQISCLLVPSEEIDLANEVPGVIRRINVDRGDYVKRGEVLLSLEQSLEVAEVELAQAKVEFLERKLQRNHELIQKNLIADYEADELVTERDIALLELNSARKKLEQKIIYSPVDAVVESRLVSKAEYAGTTPLMVLAVLDPLHAEIVMAAEYYGTISKDKMVTIIPEGGKFENVTGRVKIVDQIIDAASNTFGIQVEIDNPDLKLPAGLRCEVKFVDN